MRAIFLRQGEVFSRRMHGGERLREKPVRHDFAENIPQICHRVVRPAGPGSNSFELLATCFASLASVDEITRRTAARAEAKAVQRDKAGLRIAGPSESLQLALGFWFGRFSLMMFCRA
jgi:hypothetical protein